MLHMQVGTAGDCYIVAGGLMRRDDAGFMQTDTNSQPEEAALAVFHFARDLLTASHSFSMPHTGKPMQMRVGIHTGDCVSGLVGSTMPKFTVYGATVNIA